MPRPAAAIALVTSLVLTALLAVPGCAGTASSGAKVSPQTKYATLPEAVTKRPPPAAPQGEGGNVTLPRYPSIRPDGAEVVFSWRGDLWKVPTAGGAATRLTSHPGNELRSAWSRDGERIAFESDRNGFTNIHVMGPDGSGIRMVTDTDRGATLGGFGEDGAGTAVIAFSSYLEGDLYRQPRPYQIVLGGGSMDRIHDAFGREPAIHPDGTRVAFTRGAARPTRRHYRGAANYDLWLFDRTDGSFTRLTSFDGNDTAARWAGGDTLLFLSDREQNCVNLYRMDVSSGGADATRLTGFQRHDVQSYDVSADGKTAVLHVWGSLYSLDLSQPGAEPVRLRIEAPEDEQDRYDLISMGGKSSEAQLSPDGKTMAYVAYGEVYVRNVEDKSPTQRVTETHARERDIAWSPDGLKLYFVSDSDGTLSIYAATVALTRKEVKEEFEKALNPPPPEEDKKEDDAGEKPDDDAPPEEPKKEEGGDAGDDQPAAAADGDEPAAAGADEDGDEDDAEKKKPDDKKKKKKKEELPKELRPERWQDAIRFEIQPVIQTEHHDRAPRPSPDGKSLAFIRGRGDLHILDIESGESRVLAPGWDSWIEARWSPDSRHVAYAQSDLDFNSDIWIVPADGSEEAVNITRHPDPDGSPRWSADGRLLAFISGRVNDESDVWMVYLDAELEAQTPKEREQYYKDAVAAAKKRKPLKVEKPKKKDGDDPGEDGEKGEEKGDAGGGDAEAEAAGKPDDDEKKPDDDDDDEEAGKEDGDEKKKKDEPVELDLEDAYLRLRRVTTLSGNEGDLELTPGGDLYIFSATIGEVGLYSVKWDGQDRKKLGGTMSVQGVSLTGDKLVVLSGGRAATIPPGGGKLETVDIADRMKIDLEEQSSQKFLEAARILGEMFYHPTMKGLDWAALTEEYHALAREARTASEFNDVANRFLGELNGSHLGITAPGPTSELRQEQGRLGTAHRRVEGGFEVETVIPLSPAELGAMALEPGDVLTAIDGEPFGPTDTVESRLAGLVGKEILLTIRRALEDGEPKSLDLLITPISWRQEQQLRYRALRRDRARMVSEWSDGRIGYIHIQAMGQAALDVFERDLFAAAEGKKGLIIDVRDNGGGWTTDRLLSSIMVRPHAYTIPRGADPTKTGHYPQDRLFIQRYPLPINMMCNENSYSNAEIISHAFKTLDRGTLVGQETFGAVISTGGTRLIDGTFVRLPFRGWFLPDGTDMEDGGAVPDIIVEQTPEAEAKGEDPQLRAAVDDLLKRI